MSDKKSKHHLNSLKPGHKIHWYEINEILGEGGFGITYLAHDINLNHEVAIKEYMPVDIATREADGTVHPISAEKKENYLWGLERFLDEAKTIAQFQHPNIVRVRSVFEANNTAYMVMDYELGESLHEILMRRKTLEEEDIKNIIFPIIDGIRIVHAAGFIHRDIKPANIFIRVDGDPVLLDFGSARESLGMTQQSMTSIVSRGYAPIEQHHSGDELQGSWTDIYSLGATLYRCIAGVPPSDAIDRSASISLASRDTYVSAHEFSDGQYSNGLLQAIDDALQFKIQDRPQDISEWKLKFGNEQLNSTLNNKLSEILESNQEASDLLSSTLQAADRGDISAISNLGFMYVKGIGVEQNEKDGVMWYRKAGGLGHLTSQFNLGVMYAKGRGVEQNYVESLKWYKMAAEQGDLTAQATLGMMFAKGIGCEKNNGVALHWYQKAASKGDVKAQYNLGNMYSKGIGTDVDDLEAFRWYQKAAEQDHPNAQLNLAYIYGKGLGVKRDDVKSFEWYKKSAEHGHPNAQFNLGVIYAKGRGTDKDEKLSREWYKKSAEQGNENAERVLIKLDN
ncbi:MAG: SEL1-like repeat protein [Proteobacteria bacterium]|nr:SEL1-like repeat protein [Pseudomonadota bacterium]